MRNPGRDVPRDLDMTFDIAGNKPKDQRVLKCRGQEKENRSQNRRAERGVWFEQKSPPRWRCLDDGNLLFLATARVVPYCDLLMLPLKTFLSRVFSLDWVVVNARCSFGLDCDDVQVVGRWWAKEDLFLVTKSVLCT